MDEISILGTIYDRKTSFRVTGYGAVYDTEGIISSLTTMQGGGNKPMIVVRSSEREDNNERNK